ncbi:TFIIB-type zinc ribbon-containing protein [Parasphingorhabdus litoris]|uniref:TFIIB-type zinc ribbon-containing protein n=1 Tax=Parasphingorhabdus litoris TaxID=394733 RepID=UPI001E311611|nr:zf-TFIIB domain-containing protein [Parasphingorhabdus litoris]
MTSSSPNRSSASQTAPAMPCPVCNVSLMISERQGVEIDFCPQCRGVWLDRGEIDKIVERSRPAEIPRAEQTYRPDRTIYSDSYDHRRYKKKRRKSFLEDLFD